MLWKKTIDLHTAARRNLTEDIQRLLDSGYLIDALDAKGFAPLHWAAYNGHEGAVRLLIKRGAQRAVLNKSGQTASAVAEDNGHMHIVAILKVVSQVSVKAVQSKLAPARIPSTQAMAPKKEPAQHKIPLSQINDTSITGKTHLLQALEKEEYDEALSLLDRGADPNIPDTFGDLPLNTIVQKGDAVLRVVQALLRKKAHPLAKDSMGNTPLHQVAQQGDKAIALARELITYRADVNIPNDLEETPFTLAWSCSSTRRPILNSAIIRLFLEHGAPSDIIIDDTPLLIDATRKTNAWDLVQAVVDHGANVNCKYRGRAAIFFASSLKTHVADFVNLLAEQGANLNATDEDLRWTPLHDAVFQGDAGYETAKALLERKADVRIYAKNGQTALHFAAVKGYLPTVKLLLSYGADPLFPTKGNNPGATSLDLARSAGFYETASCLENSKLSKRASQVSQTTSHHHALYASSLHSSHTSRDPIVDSEGNTALHKAILNGELEQAQRLLENGANPNATNAKKETAAAIAATNCISGLRFLQLLKQYHAILTLTDASGWTPLHVVAVVAGKYYEEGDKNYDIGTFLLDNGVEVDAESHNGETALYYALKEGRPRLIELLILRGADPHKTLGNGKSCYTAAGLITRGVIKKALKKKEGGLGKK